MECMEEGEACGVRGERKGEREGGRENTDSK